MNRIDGIAESIAKKILDAEDIADEEDGCEHTEDGSGLTCWNCRKARYELAVKSTLIPEVKKLDFPLEK